MKDIVSSKVFKLLFAMIQKSTAMEKLYIILLLLKNLYDYEVKK